MQAGAWAALTTAYRTHASKLRARPVGGGKGLYESCHHFTVAQAQLLFYGTQDGKLLDDSILAHQLCSAAACFAIGKCVVTSAVIVLHVKTYRDVCRYQWSDCTIYM